MEKATIQSHRGEVREETIVPLSDSDLYVKGGRGRKGGAYANLTAHFPLPSPNQPTNQPMRYVPFWCPWEPPPPLYSLFLAHGALTSKEKCRKSAVILRGRSSPLSWYMLPYSGAHINPPLILSSSPPLPSPILRIHEFRFVHFPTQFSLPRCMYW